MNLNPLAAALNADLEANGASILQMLSQKGKNIFFDTSSSLFALDKNKARMMLRDLGEDRFMFGTDFPVWKAEDELRRFMALGLSEEENRKILGLNLEKLFKVKL